MQKADSTGSNAWRPPRPEATHGGGPGGRPAALQKARRTALPGLAGPAWPGPEGPRPRWANQKQHSTWDRYTHISLTLSQVTQSRTARNKNKELVSPQRRQAGVLTGVWLLRGGGWMGRGVPCWAGAPWDAVPGPRLGGGVLLKATHSELVWANQPDRRLCRSGDEGSAPWPGGQRKACPSQGTLDSCPALRGGEPVPPRWAQAATAHPT